MADKKISAMSVLSGEWPLSCYIPIIDTSGVPASQQNKRIPIQGVFDRFCSDLGLDVIQTPNSAALRDLVNGPILDLDHIPYSENQRVLITGGLVVDGFTIADPLELTRNGNGIFGRPQYSLSGFSTYIRWDSPTLTWVFNYNDGIRSGYWNSTQNVATPDLVTNWQPYAPSGAEGTPLMNFGGDSATHLLQVARCTIGSNIYLFMAATISPTTWVPISSNIMFNTETDEYRQLHAMNVEPDESLQVTDLNLSL